MDHFAVEGLTTDRYLKAAIKKRPSLFYHSPATIAANIEGFVRHFSSEGLTTQQYLQASLAQPSLFTQSPSTLAANIEGVVGQFSAEGLTTRRYLKAALAAPQLFGQSPETIARHISIVFDLAERGIFRPPGVRQSCDQVSRDVVRSAALDFLMSNPTLLPLADDNFRLRELDHQLTDGSGGGNILRPSRIAVERSLARHLGHNDLAQPVPNDNFAAGTTSPTEDQAKRLLLRALIHAGYLKGGSLER